MVESNREIFRDNDTEEQKGIGRYDSPEHEINGSLEDGRSILDQPELLQIIQGSINVDEDNSLEASPGKTTQDAASRVVGL